MTWGELAESTVVAPDAARLVATFAADLPVLIAEAEELIACESPSSDLAAVARSAAVVARIGRAHLGVDPEVLVIAGCTHLRWRFGSARRRVVVLGHHDTVWPVGAIEQHPVGTRDGVLRGPGCFDMKVGVVMAIHAVASLEAADGVTLLITGDEEIGSTTSRTLIEDEARGCDAALVLEASAPGGALKVQRKGRAHYDVRIDGRAAHAGLEPEKGVNAAVELAHQLLAAQALAAPEAGTTVTPSLVRGGTAANTVPAAASFSLDVRAVTAGELHRVDDAVHSLRPVLEGARVLVTGAIDRPPLERSASAALFSGAIELAAALGDDDLRGMAVGGGSDGNLTAALGVPTLDGLGAMGDGAHADHEHVLVDALPARTALVALLIARVLRSEPTSGSPT